MADQKPVEASAQEMKHAEHLWANFTKASKWVVIISSVVMIGLALAFVPFL